MDAVEFFEEHDRMCNSFGGNCTDCEIYKVTMSNLTCNAFIFTCPRKMVAIVERWAKEHPRKTRQNELLKLFPRVSMTADSVIAFCPESMDSAFVCPIKERDSYDPECGECRKKYWLEEMENDDQSND